MTGTMVREADEAGSAARSRDYDVFELGPLGLQCGLTLPDAKLAYRTYGQLNTARDNAVLMPTFFGGQHTDTELMLAPGRALNPEELFVVVPDMLGDGLSSSPSNTAPPFDGAGFPHVTVHDNVTCQYRLVTEHFGIDRLRLVVGFSMGAQQAFEWGARYPGSVQALMAICGSARTSPQNRLLLQGARYALTSAADFDHGWYREPPTRALRAFCRVYGSLVACAEFYSDGEYAKLGLASADDVMRFFEGFFRQRDAHDLLAQLWTWEHADISTNDRYQGDLQAALRGIRARAIVMPSRTDLLFAVADIEREVALMPNAKLSLIPSNWGHLAGFGANAPDNAFVDAELVDLLTG